MQFTAQAKLRQSSHLFVIVNGGSLSLFHVVADYEGGGSFSHQSDFPLPDGFSLEILDEFLSKVLLKWQKEISWELLDCEGEVCYIPQNSQEEFDNGLDGATLIIDASYYVEDFKSTLLGVKAVQYDQQAMINGAAGYFDSLGASEMIFVNLGWDEIIVLALAQNKDIPRQEGNICVKEFRIDNSFDLDSIYERISKVQGMSLSEAEVSNTLKNLFHKKICRSTSIEIADLLRSFVTIKLFDLQDSFFKQFGFNGTNPLLLIGGDLAKLLPRNYSVLSVIDGLQLRGSYEVGLDLESRFTAGAVTQRDREFICPLREIYPGGYRYVSTEKGGSGKMGKVAFRGEVKYNDERETSLILGQVGNIYTFNVQGEGEFFLKPAKNVYFPNLEREGDYLKGEFKDSTNKLVLDCRKIPVIYGPDVEANASRMRDWLQGLKLGIGGNDAGS
jgi:hypothetical protein